MAARSQRFSRSAVEVATSSHEATSLLEYLVQLVRRRTLAFGLCTVLSLGVSAAYLYFAVPLYTSEALIVLGNSAEFDNGLRPPPSTGTSSIETEAAIITSPILVSRVIKKLNLQYDDELINDSTLYTYFSGVASELADTAYDLFDALLISKVWPEINQEKLEPPVSEDDILQVTAVQSFLRKLSVRGAPTAMTLQVSYVSFDPEKAAKITNAVVQEYFNSQLEAKFDDAQRTTAWLSNRLDQLRQKVRKSEEALQDYREKANLIGAKGDTISGQQLAQLNSQLIVARLQRAEADARLSNARSLIKAGKAGEVGEVLNSLLIQRLREDETALLGKRAEFAKRYGERHPQMVHLDAELRDLERSIDDEVKKVLTAMEAEVNIAKGREESLSRALSNVESQVAQLNKANVVAEELQREAAANRVLYESFLGRFKVMTEEADFQQTYARLVSPAVAPPAPSWPAKKMVALIGLVLGLSMGLGMALLQEQFDAGFRTVDQLEERTGLPVLAMVPELKVKGHLPHREAMLHHQSAYTESMHLLRTGLQLANARKPFKSLVVTSSIPDEGKSILAATLACISARAGQRTLLIDTDFRHPSLSSYFSIKQKRGLIDVLIGNNEFSESIFIDRDSGAFVLPVGSRGIAGGPDLLRSKKMRELLRYINSYFDQVILDCPPLLATSEPIVLASAADATLFVTRWGRTKRETVATALRQLQRPGIRLVGVALCRVDMRKQHRYGEISLIEYYGKY